MKLILIFFLIFFVSCRTQRTIIDGIEFSITELSYGSATAKSIVQDPMKNSPTGFRTYSDDFVVIHKSDSIEMKLGSRFGVEYFIVSSKELSVPLETEWIYPKKVINTEGRSFKNLRYKTSRASNEKTFSSYILDKEFELVPGRWTFRLYFRKKMIYQRFFYLK